jgi:two-component system phosphate regulon sensor histidine kinase PhoR
VENLRLRLVYALLVPALVVAACVLGYYAYQTAQQVERLGEQSIAESGMLLLQDKIDRIEQAIIAADNQAFAAIELDDENPLADWKVRAEELSPSVRALIVLDQDRRFVAYAARASNEEQRSFRKFFMNRVLSDLELDGLDADRLKHLHRMYDGKSFLFSYKTVGYDDRTLYLIAQHDIGYLTRELFPTVLNSEPGQSSMNIVDQDGRRTFGRSLAESGDYVASQRFPTTLYAWRVQVAPTMAPLLSAKRATSRVNQLALIGLSVLVIFVAVGFILYAADKERRVAELKSDFIATVSHELKTPLSVIRMFGEMLVTKRVVDAGKQQEYLEIICSESERLSGLIENVLDFAALERGKRRYEMHSCDLAEIAQRAIDTLRYRFEREGVSVRLVRVGDQPRGFVDEQAILLVVMNLLDNAVKYGGHTPIEVTVETMSREIQIRVRDHGPGIAQTDRKRVFERFYRAKNAREARGSGIGLAIVKRIAEEHHGRVWIGEPEGPGALIAFSIPRREPTAGMLPTELESDTADAADAAAPESSPPARIANNG